MDKGLRVAENFHVAMRPAWRDPNPYTGMLADSLIAAGLSVTELHQNFGSVWQSADVLVLHWPDEFFTRAGWRKSFRGYRSLGALWLARLIQRKAIVWVAHNVQPHAGGEQDSRVRLWSFFRLISGVVYLSATSRALVASAHPHVIELPSLVIAHGDYRPIEHRPPTPPEHVEGQAVRLAFIGQVKRYKGPDILARLVAAMPAEAVQLTIAGACRDEALANELVTTAASRNIDLQFGFLRNEEMEAKVDAADVIVLPYRDILNSGSALLGLSRHRPVVAPRLGSLVELQQEVGQDWLYLYPGELSAPVLEDAITWARRPRSAAGPDLSHQDWSSIGSKLAAFLLGLKR